MPATYRVRPGTPPAGTGRFRALGVRTVIDLRYPWEISARGRVPHGDGLTWLNLRDAVAAHVG